MVACRITSDSSAAYARMRFDWFEKAYRERPSYLNYLNVEPSLDNLCSPSMPEANRECPTDLADVLHAAMEARRAERSRGRVTVYKPSRLRLRTASRLDYSGFTKLRGEMNGRLKCSAVARRT